MKTGIRVFLETRAAKLLQSDAVRTWARKYPIAYEWTISRFRVSSFTGLPLTLMAIVFTANTLLLADLAEDVVNAEGIILLDSRITQWLYDIRTDGLASAFYLLTQMASVYTVAGVALVSALVIIRMKRWMALWGMLITIAGSMITMASGKHIFEVNRPHQFAYYHEESFSFPSGHATIAASFYLYILYLLLRSVRGTAARIALVALFLGIVLLIGVSRLYLGVHYFSDVTAGYCLGLGWLLLSISLVEWQREV